MMRAAAVSAEQAAFQRWLPAVMASASAAVCGGDQRVINP
jgi:hypothetical protein